VADQTVRPADPHLRERLAAVIDREAKIPLALASLGPIAGRRVVVLDPDDGLRADQLGDLGGVVSAVSLAELPSVPARSADVIVACWSAIRPGEEPAASQVAESMRILDPAGRLLVVHDYGRDDVSAVLGAAAREPQLGGWSHRQGPFLAYGFKVRVLHCWWTWDTLDEAVALLRDAFGSAGESLAATMHRPRLSYKVAVYHRDHELAPGTAA